MENDTLIYPMFAMVLLTFTVLIALFRSRVQSVVKGQVKASYFKVYQGDEPDSSLKLSRHFTNIFEAPTLFYVACLAAMLVKQNSVGFLILAWLYVALRIAHAFIHTGNNKLRPRIAVYFSSWVVLMVMWLYLLVGIM
jgi:hypothetical protein